MLNLAAVLAILAGAGGILLSQVGNLIPSRKDFMATLRLRKVACIEKHASSHCFLMKQFLAVGLEDFDNVMRGDGRTSRDYFWEHSKNSVEAFRTFQALKGAEFRFRLAHYLLLISTISLILFGIATSTWKLELPPVLWIGLALFAVELISILVLYVLSDTNED